MSNLAIFDVAGHAMSAQNLRLTTIASNLANANSVAGTENEAYRAKKPVFEVLPLSISENRNAYSIAISDIVDSQEPVEKKHEPMNPKADENGYVYYSNVNVLDEMADMISASRSYQTNVTLVQTSRDLMLKIISLGE